MVTETKKTGLPPVSPRTKTSDDYEDAKQYEEDGPQWYVYAGERFHKQNQAYENHYKTDG
jgi:hypothetical protein